MTCNQGKEMNLKKIIIVQWILLSSLAALTHASPDRKEFPSFNRNNDLLLCQFDNRADADDLHTQAAVGSMMRHADLEDVKIYAVLGATGMQATDIIESSSLMSLVFGPEGADTWTDARSMDERIGQPNSRWAASVKRVKNVVKPILLNGGNVWVMEAGQSHITADWIQALQDDGISPDLCKAHIYIVQHSTWNHKQNRKVDLDFVTAHAQYIRIDDGNHDTNDRKQENNDTADYETDDAELDVQKGLRAAAKTAANPDAAIRSFWKEADQIIADIGFNEKYSIIDEGGLDFSDTVEAWWIMELGDVVDTVPEFWSRYVIKDDGRVRGLVTDTEEVPLDGVEISWNGEAVKTKADGRFIWKSSTRPSGKIQLHIEKLGYESQTVTVSSESATPLAIALVSTGDPLAAYTISKVNIEPEVLAIMAEKWGDDFKHAEYPRQYFDTIITLKPGDAIQDAINEAHDAGGGIVFLTEGAYETETLKLKSKVTLCGAGRAKTIVTHTGTGSFMEQGAKKLTDIIFKDLTFQGGSETGSGLNLRGDNNDRHERFMWQNVTVTKMGSHGIGISRVNHIIMDNSVFQHNGTTGGLHHNVYFLFVGHVLQSDCDMSYPTEGKSNKYTSTKYLLTQRCVMKDGKGNGIQADNDQGGYLFFHKHHLSGFERVAMWFPCESYYGKFEYTEDPKWVPQNVILNRCEVIDNTWGAMWRVVQGKSYVLNSTFDNQKIDMGLLKCNVKIEDSTFTSGNEIYTDVEQWPQDVPLLW
jgi:hypothetical protein